MTNELYVVYEEERKSLSDDDDCDYDRDYVIDVKVIGLCQKEPEALYFSRVKVRTGMPCVGGRVFLLVVRHSGGDSFGSSIGHAYFEGVYYNMHDAAKIAESIRNGVYVKDTYMPWVGWPCHLEDIEIHSITLKENLVDSICGFKLVYHD